MQSGELKSGLPDEAEQESIVAWYLVQFRRALAKPHHLSNTLLICSTGKFKSSASLSTSVIDLEQAVEAVL